MEKDRNKIIDAWIEIHKAGPDSEVYDEKFWAWEHFSDMAFTNPGEALNLILDTLKKDSSDRVLSNLAAGPLEDLLAQNGKKVIDRVEAIAKRDGSFANLLGGVWRNSIDPEVWSRIEAARKAVW